MGGLGMYILLYLYFPNFTNVFFSLLQLSASCGIQSLCSSCQRELRAVYIQLTLVCNKNSFYILFV